MNWKGMTLGAWLTEGFEYDRWANLQWAANLVQFPEPNQAEPVLQHIVWALEMWLVRVDPVWEPENASLRLRVDRACSGWQEALIATPLDLVIHYRNTGNQPFKRQFGAIALHVINHGSYHRGQLRAIADEQGHLGFPETDLNLFWIERRMFEE